MKQQIIEQRLEELRNDDLEAGMISETLCYAIDEHPEIILEILKADNEDTILELALQLRKEAFAMYDKENYDSAERLVIEEGH